MVDLNAPYDPLAVVTDQPLVRVPLALEALRAYRSEQKLALLPGIDPTAERERLSRVLEVLIDELLAGLEGSPSKLWVMKRFQRALKAVQYEDTEGREHFGMELERVMDLVGIESSDGLLNFYLVGI